MSTTVQQILDAAFAHSFQNRPNTIATSATELVGVVDRRLSELFAMVAPVNPTFFGTALQVTFSGSPGGWLIPVDAELVWRITKTNGSRIVTVPFDDLAAEPLVAALTQRGAYLYTAGNTLDPTSGDIIFYYSRQSITLTALSDTLDVLWPEKYNSAIILIVAAYLAEKDNRPNEGAVWRDEGARWAAMLQQRAEQQMSVEVRRTGFPRKSLTKRTVPALGTSKAG